ncbi:family 43 glycosylhydrolase [Spirosoma sp.]|uniref:family 43 glycosylhydrolase n=1 Tax=Spirosoma sp. TaxID=1899569 RepID=UPI0026157F50|nr:family 43 glycosylhydrolase [Spirosoma sp.]MCX6219231.1 family 43 glycosylhydrolase [Spirosoma sp.]
MLIVRLLLGLSMLIGSLRWWRLPDTPVPNRQMMYRDTSRLGRPFAKDPHVIAFGNRYLMYYSIPAGPSATGWGIGIAESKNLIDWQKVGEVTPDASAPYEKNGLCAPCALVKDGRVHLFYQTYGNREKDAICHAVSANGITFTRDETNPIFRPNGAWTCGRAIDAEVIQYKNQYLLYFATRNPAYTVQMQGVAAASLNTTFARNDWKLLADSSILRPVLPWEKKCVEGASCLPVGKSLYMFYAGGYNNEPQQIGVAVSTDAVRWQRLSDEPLLKNGEPGSWNASESGHPHVFKDRKGGVHLFFQGNSDNGKTWYISQRTIHLANGRWVVD